MLLTKKSEPNGFRNADAIHRSGEDAAGKAGPLSSWVEPGGIDALKPLTPRQAYG